MKISNIKIKEYINQYLAKYISFEKLYNLISLDLPIYYDLNIFRSFYNGQITCENFDLEMQNLADKLTTDPKMCAACGDYLAEIEVVSEELDANLCHPITSRICGVCANKIFRI
jgi:hypothetical protein